MESHVINFPFKVNASHKQGILHWGFVSMNAVVLIYKQPLR